MEVWKRIGMIGLAGLLIVIGLLTACGGGNGDKIPEPNGTRTPETSAPVGKVTITIGNITPITGPVSAAIEPVNLALKDMIRYANEENLVPGVELKVIEYDGQFDPAKDIPAYEWLKQNGADLMVTTQTNTQPTLKSRVDQDHMLLFGVQAFRDALEPPGWNFNFAHYSSEDAYMLLKWVAENDWDYQTRGPAKIGVTDWDLEIGKEMARGAKAYCQAHPEQFQWVGSYIVPVNTFLWNEQIEALKNCDYIIPPSASMLASFAKPYRDAGGRATLLGFEGHVAAINLWDDASLWDELDGMIVTKDSMWWNDDGDTIDLTREMLYRYRSGETMALTRSSGYNAAGTTWFYLVQLIKSAVDAVGAQNVDPEALYAAAQSFSMSRDGIEDFGTFTLTKRTFNNYGILYRVSQTDRDLVRVTDWILRPTSP